VKDLRKIARGQDCKIMLPGYGHDSTTTVLCHWRHAGITGGGLKAPDIMGAHGCYDCHRVTEGEQLTAEEKRLDREWLDLMFLHGVMRTQYALVKQGIIKW
jgi:hypothetical protein